MTDHLQAKYVVNQLYSTITIDLKIGDYMDTDSFLNLKVLNSIYVVFTVTIDCSKIKMGYI